MKKLFRSLFILSLSVVGLSGCSLEELFGGNSRAADHIEVRDYTESVIKGKEYTFDGKVFAIYENEDEEEVTKNCKFDYSTFDTSSIGKTKFKVTYEDAKYIHSKSVYIDVIKDSYTALKSISLPETIKVRLSSGAKTITPTFTPSNASNKEVEWSIEDTSIATVSSSGVITPKAIGNTTLTVTSKENSAIKATANINVHNNATDDWTILVYMCGADLESGYANKTMIQGQPWDGCGLATKDIVEILSVNNKPDDVNIVIETGGASTWTNKTYGQYGDYNIDSTKLQIHHVENNKLSLDDTLTYASMGKQSTLQSFIEYGLTYYEADNTALILWNHGGAMQGVCFDEKASNDSLLDYEVTAAVSSALASTGHSGEKLEFIGYDACLMQVQDIAYENAPYFNYMIASQEYEEGYGWDYDTWLDDLYNGASTTDILKAIADGFIADNGGVNNTQNNQTMSYLNLSYANEFYTAWENMAGALKSKITNSNKDDFNTLVETVKTYCEDEGDNQVYGLFDYFEYY